MMSQVDVSTTHVMACASRAACVLHFVTRRPHSLLHAELSSPRMLETRPLLRCADASARLQSTTRGRAPASSADADFSLEGLISSSDDDIASSRVGVRGRQGNGGPRAAAAAAPADDPAVLAERARLREVLAELRASEDAAAKPDKRRRVPAIVDPLGGVLPLASEDEEGLVPTTPADNMDPAQLRAAAQQLRYHTRALRGGGNDTSDLEMYAIALEREFGSDLEVPDIDSALRVDDYAVGEDPLLDGAGAGLPFKLDAITFKTHMTWNAPLHSRALDRCVAIWSTSGRTQIDAVVAIRRHNAYATHSPLSSQSRCSLLLCQGPWACKGCRAVYTSHRALCVSSACTVRDRYAAPLCSRCTSMLQSALRTCRPLQPSHG